MTRGVRIGGGYVPEGAEGGEQRSYVVPEGHNLVNRVHSCARVRKRLTINPGGVGL